MIRRAISIPALGALTLVFGCNLIIGADEGILAAGAGGGGGSIPSTGGQGVGGSTTGEGGQGGDAGLCNGVDCNDDNPCTDDACVDGACPHVPAVGADLSALQTTGDCKSIICGGDPPSTVAIDDDLDAPGGDGNECTQDICVNGVPYPYEATGTVCNTTGFCDAVGNCSACVMAVDCGADTVCGARKCTGTPPACGWTYSGSGASAGSDGTAGNCQALFCTGSSEVPASGADNTDLPANVPNDCRSPSCSAGSPGQLTINNTDLPVDVANDCKDPACSSGVPSTTNQATGTTCDDGASELSGQCSVGTCRDCTTAVGCVSSHPCISNACCTPLTMAVACTGIECGMASDGCGGMVTCPNTCATSLKGPDCTGNVCTCSGSTDCFSSMHYGGQCISSTCGCNDASDCSNSPRGEACIAATSTCGCNGGADCPGPPTCISGLCQ